MDFPSCPSDGFARGPFVGVTTGFLVCVQHILRMRRFLFSLLEIRSPFFLILQVNLVPSLISSEPPMTLQEFFKEDNRQSLSLLRY